MKQHLSYQKIRKAAFYLINCAILAVALLFVPSFPKLEMTDNHFYTIFVNGTDVGCVDSLTVARTLMGQARRQLAGESEEILYSDAALTWEKKDAWFGKLDDEQDVRKRMVKAIEEAGVETLQPAYTVKINDFMVNLSDSDDVRELLKTVLAPYDPEHEFELSLIMDPDRELNVLTTSVNKREDAAAEESSLKDGAGVEQYFAEVFAQIEPDVEKSEFSDLDYGLVELDFADTVEIVESWLPAETITALDDAVAEVTLDQEKEQIYEVKSGDTLSQIAEEHALTEEELLAINPALEDEEAILRIGDEIKITVPEPILSVLQTKRVYTEGSYEAAVEYQENDSWYTTKQEVLQQPSAGFRKAAALVTSRNDTVIREEIMKEEVSVEAVAKIVERGTKIPPTYIKPISGGRITSNYGGRTAPTKGASTNHKGTDWATPTGTAVMASSGGTVTRAGWGSGYGYVVYISHEDGRETRYGHLSKILVKAGQKVRQGEKIALSGNTGRSTGPHLHFELRINGEAVNALKYLE